MTVEVLDKQFQVYIRPHNDATKSYALNEDGSLTIEGIASTTSKDLQDDIVTSECIESMKQQLLNGLNLHGDHWYGLFDGVIGAIKEVIPTDTDSLKIKAVILPKYAQDIKDMIDIGVNLGLSIGGRVTEYITLEDGGWEIKNIALREISLTAMPVNWDTYGTITTSKGLVKSTCLAGACYKIMKNEVDKMAENNTTKEETLTRQDVVDLINESLVSFKEEVVDETIQAVSKQLDKLVADAIEAATEEEEKDETDPQEESNEEEDEEKSSIDMDSIKNIFHEELGAIKSEILESIPQTDMDAVNEAIKSAVSEETDKLFKNLDSQRDPQFTYQEEDIKTDEEPVAKTEFTANEIAEQLVAKQNKEDFLKSLL